MTPKELDSLKKYHNKIIDQTINLNNLTGSLSSSLTKDERRAINKELKNIEQAVAGLKEVIIKIK